MEKQATEKIKVKDLLKYPFKIKKEPVGSWDLEYILQNLNIDSYNIDNSKFNPELFQIKEIYDNPHDSDELSYRYLLYFKNEFTCLYGYTGDRGTDVVLFASMQKKLILRDYLLSLTPEYNDTSDIIDEEIDLSDNYTFFFKEKDEFYYLIKSPYWSYCYRTQEENLYYIEDDETLISVKFVKFKLTNRHDYSQVFDKKNHFMTIKKIDGNEFEVPFHRVIFKVEKEK